jgi:hypothetical protein
MGMIEMRRRTKKSFAPRFSLKAAFRQIGVGLATGHTGYTWKADILPHALNTPRKIRPCKAPDRCPKQCPKIAAAGTFNSLAEQRIAKSAPDRHAI